jgi:CRISPR-associated protein Cst2
MAIQSASISGRVTLDMHSLNNEGGEGNQVQTRMVHIVDANGELAVVNAISGDMLKHIQAEHLQALASSGGKLPLCNGCKKFSANRVNDDAEFGQAMPAAKEKGSNEKTIDQLLERCVVDDAEGVLITIGNRSVPRKSTVEFGWAVGLPDKTRTESYFHVKYAAERGAGSGGEGGANVGQNIFYRPASSGVYAVVANVDLWRIGWNDISREYPIGEDDRKARRSVLWQSVLHTFVAPLGAHRNTQNPHILDIGGVLSWSTSRVPAPTFSALKDGYEGQAEGVAAALNRMGDGGVEVRRFASYKDLADLMADLGTEV